MAVDFWLFVSLQNIYLHPWISLLRETWRCHQNHSNAISLLYRYAHWYYIVFLYSRSDIYRLCLNSCLDTIMPPTTSAWQLATPINHPINPYPKNDIDHLQSAEIYLKRRDLESLICFPSYFEDWEVIWSSRITYPSAPWIYSSRNSSLDHPVLAFGALLESAP